jgi:hypothetical protein
MPEKGVEGFFALIDVDIGIESEYAGGAGL